MESLRRRGAVRVTRAFAFVDLCGFTEFLDAKGDTAALRELRDLRTVLREAAAVSGVRIDKWLGDGAMVVAVEPAAVVDAMVTLRAAHGRRGHLRLRVGVAAGPVLLLDGDDYVGRVVNLASRLSDLAEADEILAAVDGLELPDGVSADPRQPLEVKGFAEPVSVASLRPTRQRRAV